MFAFDDNYIPPYTEYSTRFLPKESFLTFFLINMRKKLTLMFSKVPRVLLFMMGFCSLLLMFSFLSPKLEDKPLAAYGIEVKSDGTAILYFEDQGWRGNWHFLCLGDHCVSGKKVGNRWERDITAFNIVVGNTYQIQIKIDDVNEQFISPLHDVVAQSVDSTTPTCTDGIQNGDETGIDCGGSCPNDCSLTNEGSCGEFGITYVNNNTGIIYHRDNNYRANFNFLCLDGDCRPGTLEDGYYKRTVTVNLNQTYNVEFKVDDASGQVIVNDQFTFTTATCSFTGSGTTPTCTDGIQNGNETGVDCGGDCPNNCPQEPTCTDGIRNGNETGVDCGGDCPNNCPQEPTCTDGIRNGNETGVDCGGDCPNACPQPPTGDLAFLEPTNGAKLLFIGQDLLSVSDYIRDCENCPTPGGTATYVNLAGVLQNDFYGALGWTEADQPYGTDIDWGGGPLNAHSNAVGFTNSAVQIGLYLVGETDNIASGGRDAEIRQMADFFKALPNTAFYLRIGYEFDGQWNGYSGTSYINAYRRMVDILRAEGVSNVAYVWQSSTSPIDDILDGGRENLLDYYPGDDYVDWFGMSWFLPTNETATVGPTPSTQIFLANEMVNLARERNKPMMICESAAQGYDIQTGTNSNISTVWDGPSAQGTVTKTGAQIWDEWFQPYFDFIYANDDVIKGVTYINADWDSQGLWDAPYEQGYWGDTRIQGNSTIEANWVNEITKSGWLHGSSNLNSFLNGMGSSNPPGPTCTDGIQNGDETGVDCGGSCPNDCITDPGCTDGIQNGDETGIDCGGSCDACPSEPIIVISTSSQGMILTGGPGSSMPGFSVYTFDNDTNLPFSSCEDGCAQAWPPVIVNNINEVILDGLPNSDFPGEFNVSGRCDGTLQLTYDNKPLYFYARDNNPGDVNGQGVGDVWWLIKAPLSTTCNDGIQNGNETGVDCGGDCPNTCHQYQLVQMVSKMAMKQVLTVVVIVLTIVLYLQ